MSRRTLDPAVPLYLSLTGLSPSLAGFPNTILLGSASSLRSETPERTRSGLASFAFARRYLRNRSFFLFLALLRCFSSGGSPPHAMDSRTDAWSLSMRVSPFRHPRIIGYLHLPAAFRSLSRLSSALSAKASSLCSSSLNLLSGLAWPASWLLLLLSDVLSLSRSFKRFLILVQYSVFKVQVFLKRLSPFGRSPLTGLKWTRTTDLTLIRRAL